MFNKTIHFWGPRGPKNAFLGSMGSQGGLPLGIPGGPLGRLALGHGPMGPLGRLALWTRAHGPEAHGPRDPQRL